MVIAGLLAVAVYAGPSNPEAQTTRIVSVELPADGSAATYLWALNGSTGALAVAWRASVPVAVVLATAAGCGPSPEACTGGSPIASWTSNTSGAWSGAAQPGDRWVLRMRDGGPSAASVSAVTTVIVPPAAATPTWVIAVELAAAVALGMVGGTALFLGVFLRGGVYRSRERPPPTGPPPVGPAG